MRVTGIIVAVIGLMIAVYAGVTSARSQGTAVDAGALNLERSGGADLTVPLIFAVGAMLVGAMMYVFGGRGVWYTRNPAIRN